jgi:hypothetical protein
MTCDICLTQHAELWGFPVATFHEPISNTVNCAGEWAICDACRLLFDIGDAHGLAERVTITNSRIVKEVVERFYVLLIQNTTGPLARCADQATSLYGSSL